MWSQSWKPKNWETKVGNPKPGKYKLEPQELVKLVNIDNLDLDVNLPAEWDLQTPQLPPRGPAVTGSALTGLRCAH